MGCFISSRSDGLNFGMSLPYCGDAVVRVLAEQHGIGPPRVGPLVPAADREGRGARRRDVFGLVGGRLPDLRRQHVADLRRLRVLGAGAQRLHRLAVGAHGVVRGDQVVAELQLVPGRMHAVQVAHADETLGFVVRHPQLHAIGELVGQQRRVLREPVGRVAIQPAAALVQRLRVVPVKGGAIGVMPALPSSSSRRL